MLPLIVLPLKTPTKFLSTSSGFNMAFCQWAEMGPKVGFKVGANGSKVGGLEGQGNFGGPSPLKFWGYAGEHQRGGADLRALVGGGAKHHFM